MVEQMVKLFRCSFCSGRKRKKSFRRHVIARHETICFANPDRVPQPGEVTAQWQAGKYVWDNETGGDFVEHASMPAWWPGDSGMIYTGSKWLPIEGYEGSGGDESWPIFDGEQINKIKPWVRRLGFITVEQDDIPDAVLVLLDKYAPEGGW